MPEGGLSQADFARVMGVDRSQVTRWAGRGLPMLGDHVVAAAAGAEWVRANVDTHKLRGSIGARQMKDGREAWWAQNLLTAYTVSDENAACITAELLVPHLPEATVRAIVAELLERCRVGSAECLEEDVRPPSGCRTWRDHPLFKEAAPGDVEWTDLLARHAAGELVKVGGEPDPAPAAKARKRGKVTHA